ncbi:helix-turn-helix domain-containing protein [Actinoplanes sp. NPDC026619]|uniref:helix-turn-helix domain-containing protein n=1 Tax=Actinoplanes sp. NPDC026619 TaxID=3155798 RepID=UPI0033D07EEA
MIGDRLRDLRMKRGLSLRKLAAAAEVSPGLLSQIENSSTDPSLSTIRKLAAVFDEPISSLFEEPDAPAVHISRPGDRPQLTASGGHNAYERLTPGRGDLEVLLGRLEPGESSSAQCWAHASTECALVIEGELTAEVAGVHYRISPDQSITFDSRLAHRYLNTGPVTARFVVSVTPPNP